MISEKGGGSVKKLFRSDFGIAEVILLTDDQTAWNILCHAVQTRRIDPKWMFGQMRTIEDWLALGQLVHWGIVIANNSGVVPTEHGDLIYAFLVEESNHDGKKDG